MNKIEELKKRILQAKGAVPAELVLKNCKIIDVFGGEILEGDVAICEGLIAGVGRYEGINEIDCKGCYVAPGFMEGHIHIESSMLNPREFAKTVLQHGTTTVVCDPHEIANVAGMTGINYFIEESKDVALEMYCMAPSCVPATSLENAGASIGASQVSELLAMPQLLGLAEMMNFPGVLSGDEQVLQKIVHAQKMERPIDGHAPGLSGPSLQAYIGCGIGSDHECVLAEEAIEKLRGGMYVFIREGSTAKNMEKLLPAVTTKNSHRFLLVTDDCNAQELLTDGHLDRILRKVIGLGLDPVTAIRMVTINVATYYGLKNVGAVAPGYKANLVLFDDLHDIQAQQVYVKGKNVSDEKACDLRPPLDVHKRYKEVFHSVNVKLEELSFAIPAISELARVIKIVPNQLITEQIQVKVKRNAGFAIADPEMDILKIAVVERHHGTGNRGCGFVQGIGLKRGALASTVGHDSHNITVVGENDEDMMLAVETICRQQGGLAVVADGEVKATLALEVAGLMSCHDADSVALRLAKVINAAKDLGVQVEDPFMYMSFLALPVIPYLKITDLGLIDVDNFCHVPLWV